MSRDYGANYANAGFPSVLDDPLKLAVAHHWLEAIDRKTEANELRERWKKWALGRAGMDLTPVGLDALWQPIAAPQVELTRLPWGSWLLQFGFRLRRPYLSKDERDFYVIDNPVRREWVFGVPFMAASSWKGCLRAVLRESLPERVLRLCGNEKGAEEDFRQGRLHPFPSFFDRVGLEIINPHDRPRRVGVKPLDFECAPVGARATFTLLYVPFDLVGCPAGWRDPETGESVAEAISEDLKATANAVQTVLTETGFGAKTSSGYGVAEADSVSGVWRVNHWLEEEVEGEWASEGWVRQVTAGTEMEHCLHKEFFTDGRMPTLRDNADVRAQPWGGKAKADYKKVRDWLLPKLKERPMGPRLLEQPVADLSMLKDVAQALATALREEASNE